DPTIKKDVKGVEHLRVERERTYNYNVKSNIVDDVRGYKSLTVSDKLDKRLDVVDAKILVDGVESSYKATKSGQNVEVTFTREQLET
ncbi:isopeptide-forming domain-containing fimbrial protein, partial [Bacillus thuringiensis]|nr:isopeptide-forming domain-containing fimbrial protein [Bacillus thuringiensis]